MSGTVKVSIVTLTFRRPDDLADALPRLLGAISDHPDAEILVVDNDTVPSAQALVGELDDPRIRYVHEPHPGIAAARNRGLDETSGRDALVFIDDDERPRDNWLASLLETQRLTGAEAVAGPVVSELPHDLDPWIRAGRFFERLRHPTGTPLPVAATNNLLLMCDFVASHRLRFDEEFGLSGGSDSVFTRALVRAGGRIVWCDDAVVTDVVPPSRATRRWVTHRAFRMGNTEARARIRVTSGAERFLERGRCALAGAVRAAAGGVRLAHGSLTGSLERQAGGWRLLLRGAGMMLAAFGYRYYEYRRSGGEGAGQSTG